MAIVTSQQIRQYYEKYRIIDVTFTKEVNESLGVVRDQIFLKYRGGQRPCILYSTSLIEAKVVIALTAELISALRKDNLVTLRFCFSTKGRNSNFRFFVQSRVSSLTLYDKSQSLYFALLSFTQRPPDDLIEIVGNLLDTNINFARRREERITISKDSLRRLGLSAKNVIIQIDSIPRNGILKDVSFGGSKIIIMGHPKFLLNKKAIIKFNLTNGRHCLVRGKIIRFESLEIRKDLIALAIQYDQEEIGLEYKFMINGYLKYLGRPYNSKVTNK